MIGVFFWLVFAMLLGFLMGFSIAWRIKVPVSVNVDAELVRKYLEGAGFVAVPKGPEWPNYTITENGRV